MGLLCAFAPAALGEDPHGDSPQQQTATVIPLREVVDSGILAPPITRPELGSTQAQPLPLAITVSGAVSLGAWQAGFLHYLAETIKRNPDQVELQLVTGASAGTINALLMAMEVAEAPLVDPRDSQFWHLWNNFTYEQIFDVSQAEGPYLSSGKVLQELAAQVDVAWQKGLSSDLDVVLGAAVTRLEPRRVELGAGLTVARSQEHFVLRIQGQGLGERPLVGNYADLDAHLPQLLLPFSQPEDVGSKDDFDVLTGLLFASSAMPGAFEPQLIDFCQTPLDEGVDSCTAGDRSTRFIDGAVSDRYPLRLAWRLADQGLQRLEDDSLAWRDSLDEGVHDLPEDVLFLYMDPMHTSYPPLPSPGGITDGGSKDKIMATLAGLAGDLAGSAQASELYNLAEENPALSSRLAMVEPALPPVSGELFRFFGFFDRRFRRYDFFLGMVDAHRFVERVVQPRVRERHGEQVTLELPEPEPVVEFWRPYACIRAVVDGVGDPVQACADERHGGMEVLLQTSLDRLWDHCSRLPKATATDHALCAAAIEGVQSRPLVPNVTPEIGRAWRRRGAADSLEGDFEYLSRLLELYEFEYRDFGLPRNRAWLGTTYLREEMGGMVSAYGDKLDGRLRLLVLGAGKPALNVLHYAPPIATLHVSAGSGLEMGFSVSGRWTPHRWIRYHMALQVGGLQRFLSSRPNVVTVSLFFLGMEIEVPRLSGVLVQPRLVLRAGYQVSSDDYWDSLDCDTEAFDNDPMMCSVPSGQVLVALPIFERLRLHLGVQYDAGFVLKEDAVRDDAFTAVAGVGFQWISPFREEPWHRITHEWRRPAVQTPEAP